MTIVLYILFAILAIGIMIFTHELGHFLAARAVGIPVYEFAIGFGPKLWSRKRKDTIYSLRAIPFGGFNSFGDPNDDTSIEKYYDHAVWKRTIVTLAGSVMNILFAIVLAFFMLWFGGAEVLDTTVSRVEPDSPAYAAGLLEGDRILAVEDIDVSQDAAQVSLAITAQNGETFTMTVDRQGESVALELTPAFDEAQQRYMIGISLSTRHAPLPIGTAFKGSFQFLGAMVAGIWDFFAGLFTRGEGAGDVVGIVGVVTTMVDFGQTYGFYMFLNIVANISVNLGIMNLLPIPGLDGAKIVFLIIEAIRGKPVPPEKENIVSMIGIGLLLLVFVVVTFKDIARLFTGG